MLLHFFFSQLLLKAAIEVPQNSSGCCMTTLPATRTSLKAPYLPYLGASEVIGADLPVLLHLTSVLIVSLAALRHIFRCASCVVVQLLLI